MFLRDLAQQIKDEHCAAMEAAQRAVDHARRAGQLLLEAKRQLKHGQWLPWLRQHCTDLSPRTAQTYMQLAHLPQAEAQRVADLSLREALRVVRTKSPKAVTLSPTYQVLITCKAENEQVALLERLTGEGYQCRALMS